jgi:L-threonylcarbamoyladenylate synthase
VPDVVTAGGPTVAVRLPAHPVARELIRLAGTPLAAPSANRSTRLSPTLAQHVLADLDGLVDIILDGGPTTGGIESTVLDLTHQPPRLLRPGLVTVSELEGVIGGPIERPDPAPPANESHPLPSPGMMARHYAPRTPLEIAEEGGGLDRVRELHAQGQRVGWVTWFDVSSSGEEVPPGVSVARLPSSPAGYSVQLYATLHDLDDRNLDRIVVALPPAEEEWLAVRDRLIRAATR